MQTVLATRSGGKIGGSLLSLGHLAYSDAGKFHSDWNNIQLHYDFTKGNRGFSDGVPLVDPSIPFPAVSSMSCKKVWYSHSVGTYLPFIGGFWKQYLFVIWRVDSLDQ
jgi:hypothetical protein